MRLAILTTDTLHHRYFVSALGGTVADLRIFEETEPAFQAPFPTLHPFEEERERFEAECWFAGAPPPLSSLAETERFPSMNDPAALRAVTETRPDVIVVFGTGKLKGPLLSLCPGAFLNLHGGDPEEYRGLDTHLWAIYHSDFAALVTTLHHVSPDLDAGDIVATLPLPLHRGMGLHQLRRSNTEICVRLVQEALADHDHRRRFVSRAQRRPGRYYSAMPRDLKEICVRRFARHTDTL